MKKIESIISNTLGIKEEEINDKMGPDNLSSWDSFNSLLLISEIEKNFQVEFDVDEAASIKNVGDIKTLLKKHGVK